MWISANLEKDKEERNDLISSVLEDLHFWMNPEVYEAIKEKEERERENVLYDKQVFQMDLGNFEEEPTNYWEIVDGR